MQKENPAWLLLVTQQFYHSGIFFSTINGWLSANDIREMEDLNPISEADGGNLYLVNGNFAKLKDAGVAYEKVGDTNEKILELAKE